MPQTAYCKYCQSEVYTIVYRYIKECQEVVESRCIICGAAIDENTTEDCESD